MQNYESVGLYFILVPLTGKINLGQRPQNKISVPFTGHFQKIRRAPPSLLYGSPPPPHAGIAGLIFGELIFGGACYRKEFCVSDGFADLSIQVATRVR